MATVFSRSLRAIEADRGRRAVWGILLATALLAAWLAWFTLAQIALLEVADAAWMEAGTPGRDTPAFKVVALFAPDALDRIQPDQPARVRQEGDPERGSLPATVDRVLGLDASGKLRVELVLHPESKVVPWVQVGQPAWVEIEVERLSPAALALHAAGRGSVP